MTLHQLENIVGEQTMPPRPRPVTYAEAMAALLDAYLSVLSLLELRLGAQTRERLELLRDRLALVARRDNGRR
jgi:hypothetical protein